MHYLNSKRYPLMSWNAFFCYLIPALKDPMILLLASNSWAIRV